MVLFGVLIRKGVPKHYSFDIYSIRIPPTEAYQGRHFDFSKGVSSETNKKWRLMELNRLPLVRRIFFRASVYKASPGAHAKRATGLISFRNELKNKNSPYILVLIKIVLAV